MCSDEDPLLTRTGVATRSRYAVAEMGSAWSVSPLVVEGGGRKFTGWVEQ
jgi:hypothetical protein